MDKMQSKPYTVIELQDGKKLIYFPYKKTIIKADGDGMKEIERHITNPGVEKSTFIAKLVERGLLDADHALGGQDKGTDQTYVPTSLTLFPTMDCNLRCVYCYSSGGDTAASMDMELAKAAINQITANALVIKAPSISINLHGGGEPTLNWEVFTGAAAYAKMLGKALGLQVNLSCGTNGNMPEERALWLTENIGSACLSLDGPCEIHDAQRPARDGTSSFGNALRTLRLFEEKGFMYQIRTTASRKSLAVLPEFLEFLKQNAPNAAMLQVEPLFPVGRALKTGAEPPTAAEFFDAMQVLTKRSEELGYKVSFASCDISAARNEFCGAYGNNFVVTPAGYVTTCYETSTPDDPRWEYFNIGHYDRIQKKFILKCDAIGKLRKLSQEHLESCGDCIGRFHCAGDCPAKRLFGNYQKTGRCSVVKKLTKEQILRKVELLEEAKKVAYL